MPTKMQAVAELKRLGAQKAVGHFSGGNDEGGFDEIKLLDAAGEKVGEIGYNEIYSEGNVLAKFLNDVLYGQYGSFAGEFSVFGDVTLDVSGECKMTGEETGGYTPFDRDF